MTQINVADELEQFQNRKNKKLRAIRTRTRYVARIGHNRNLINLDGQKSFGSTWALTKAIYRALCKTTVRSPVHADVHKAINDAIYSGEIIICKQKYIVFNGGIGSHTSIISGNALKSPLIPALFKQASNIQDVTSTCNEFIIETDLDPNDPWIRY